MVFNLSELKDVCSKILAAVDSSEGSQITDTLELVVNDNSLYLSVTNREYFTRVRLPIGSNATDFHASVNASLFLKLISSLTSETVELDTTSNFLRVIGDGTYKIPLIYDGDALLELPEIRILNKTREFDVKKEILQGILRYNMSELSKGIAMRPVQRLFYLDGDGCITFTTGACVNDFSLPANIKVLLTPKVVKLFKLFKDDTVHFELGYDDIGNGIIQAKVVFSDSVTEVSSILPNDETMLNSVPVSAIRGRATYNYPYSVTLNKDSLLNAIKRLALFTNKGKYSSSYVNLDFTEDSVVVSDSYDNNEKIMYDNDKASGCVYHGRLSVDDLRLTLETYVEKHIILSFGNSEAMVISRGNVHNVLPEVISE